MAGHTRGLLYATLMVFVSAGLGWATTANASSLQGLLYESAGPGTGGPAVSASLQQAIDRTLQTNWSQQPELTASDGAQGDHFGDSVALSADGTEALVGASGHGYAAIGVAYVFTESGGTWTQVAEFTDPEGDPLDNYAQSVAISGDGLTALVGSPYGYYDLRLRRRLRVPRRQRNVVRTGRNYRFRRGPGRRVRLQGRERVSGSGLAS